MKTPQKRICPVCGSTDIGLWNEFKQTFHCHDCDCYFNKYGTIIEDRAPVYIKHCSGWNGFSDPDDYPNDGCGDSGWQTNNDMPTNITVLQYTPSEIIGIFNDIHAHQNTQAAKVLNEAKERSRYLEKQLEEALNKNKGCSTECLGMVAAIVTVASAACWVICLII